MTSILSVLLAASAGLVIIFLLLSWARCRVMDLTAAAGMLDTHYRASQRLIADPDTPESVVKFTVFFARSAGHPSLARKFALHVLQGRVKGSNGQGEGPQARQLAADLRAMSPEKLQTFAEMVVNGMAASAASDPVFSRVYLTVLTVFFSKSGRRGDNDISVDRANTAALDVTAGVRDCAYA